MTRDAEISRWDDPRIRRLYGRVLARWATDLMELRRRGLDVPGGGRRGGREGKARRRRIRMDA